MAIYKANGEEMNAAEINTVAGQLTDAYTDEAATSPASRSDLLSALAVARQANADELQVIIDADEGLSNAGVVASVDDIDEMAVVVTLPTDSGTPLFWAGQAALIVEGSGQFVEQRVDVLDDNGDPTGEKTGAWKVRMGKGRWRVELSRISALL
tara:strand:+ start:1126 stop:1587 length:462 start_codon:yes stop_codon:yes gene_type:complete